MTERVRVREIDEDEGRRLLRVIRRGSGSVELGEDKLHGHVKPRKTRARLLEPQFTALRYFALDGTDHASHREQASMIPLHHLAQQPPRRQGARPARRDGPSETGSVQVSRGAP